MSIIPHTGPESASNKKVKNEVLMGKKISDSGIISLEIRGKGLY